MTDADRFVREVVAEVVCMCNVIALAKTVEGRVVLPIKYRGMNVEEFLARMGERPVLVIDGGDVKYFLVLRLERMGLGDLARLLGEVADARRG